MILAIDRKLEHNDAFGVLLCPSVKPCQIISIRRIFGFNQASFGFANKMIFTDFVFAIYIIIIGTQILNVVML
jgi:hypothetical protein